MRVIHVAKRSSLPGSGDVDSGGLISPKHSMMPPAKPVLEAVL